MVIGVEAWCVDKTEEDAREKTKAAAKALEKASSSKRGLYLPLRIPCGVYRDSSRLQWTERDSTWTGLDS